MKNTPNSLPGPSTALPAVLFLLVLLGLWWYAGENPPVPPPAKPATPVKPRLGDLAPAPDWTDLEPFQETMSRSDFLAALERVYGSGDSWKETVRLVEDAAWIRSTNGVEFRLRFSPQTVRPPRYWRSVDELPPCADVKLLPLQGVKIALDPGHIGGQWAKMEERWYKLPNGPVAVMEGEMALRTAEILASTLESLGAEVSFVRDKLEPVTSSRPADYTGTQALREKLFYRTAEIRARAEKVNERLKPDLVLCLHFNAEGWADPANPTLTDVNHLHVLVNGCYSAGEFALEDNRHDLLQRLLQQAHTTEIPLADSVARSLAAATGLPAYDYDRGFMAGNARRVNDNPYLWARNLLANRLYHCPVVFCEPYVMNSREFYDRLLAGDYPGERVIAGKSRKSLFREYAGAVADGLKAWYSDRRTPNSAKPGS